MMSRRIRHFSAFAAALCLALVAPAPGGAQAVAVDAQVGGRAVDVLREIAQRGRYLLLSRDTILPAAFHTDGDLVVWDARVRLEGSVAGSVAVVDGTFAIRPGGRVGGTIASLNGLVLPSGLAEIGEVVELPADRRVRTVWGSDTLRVGILPPPPVPAFGLGGILGFRRVTYDRVDGLSVAWGPQWRITRAEFGPRADLWVTARTARIGSPGGGVALTAPVGGGLEAAAGAERVTLTPDAWVRGDLANSLSALAFGRDLRDYHESDRAWLRLGRPLPTALAGVDAAPYVVARASRDRSLAARRPLGIFGREGLARLNPAVADTSYLSLELGSLLAWEGSSSRFRGRAHLEYAPPAGDGLRFTHWVASGRWDMEALWNHTINVQGHVQGSLDDGPAPPQRWSHVGGQETLPTFPFAVFRGDRVAFVSTRYAIPLPLDLPVVGVPQLELLHAAGTAWLTGTPMPSWEQNVGVGVSAFVLQGRLWIDPAIDRPRPTVQIGLVLP